jgi:hypothetical protein
MSCLRFHELIYTQSQEETEDKEASQKKDLIQKITQQINELIGLNEKLKQKCQIEMNKLSRDDF